MIYIIISKIYVLSVGSSIRKEIKNIKDIIEDLKYFKKNILKFK